MASGPRQNERNGSKVEALTHAFQPLPMRRKAPLYRGQNRGMSVILVQDGWHGPIGCADDIDGGNAVALGRLKPHGGDVAVVIDQHARYLMAYMRDAIVKGCVGADLAAQPPPQRGDGILMTSV